jgi:DNA repair exonuclease SbcCD nuclease subunit
MKILHTGDNHFKEKNLEEAGRCFMPIIDASREVDITVFCGDLYDSDVLVSSSVVGTIFDLIHEVAQNSYVVIIRGNHDPSKSLRTLRKIKAKFPVFVAEELTDYGISELKVLFHCFPYLMRSTNVKEANSIEEQHLVYSEHYHEAFKILKRYRENYNVQIALGHFSVVNAELQNNQVILPTEPLIDIEKLKELPVDAVMLGHIHNAHQKIFKGTNIRYSGSHYRTNFGENVEMGFWIFDTDSKEWEWHKTPAKPIQSHKLTLDELKNIDLNMFSNGDVDHVFEIKIDGEKDTNAQRLIEKLQLIGKVNIRKVLKNKARSEFFSQRSSLAKEVEEYCRLNKEEFTPLMAEICSESEDELRRVSIGQ